jgi:hypothetical protein
VDALALEGDEGRDEQRYASGSCKWLRSGDFRMGKPTNSNVLVSYSEFIAIGSQPGELKHLINRWKRKKTIDSLSSGERNGKSPNQS